MLWIKAFHIIAVTCWFAGIFYLPRLFVYHAMADDDTSKERFIIMERKLLRGIMNPSAIAAVLFGSILMWMNWATYQGQGWLHAKLTLVILLIAYHLMCRKIWLNFSRGENRHSHVYYRWFNEFPVLLLVGIVILVVVRPF
ncbi:MAG: protoporphyrinogen oxidase HemJ [Pseudomonadales bacterium]|nr:protoporphyrinogen oxidase HemJ [Pseudomonadales bacterium]